MFSAQRFGKNLRPFQIAARRLGPKARMPSCSSRSTRPPTRGTSGPTMTKSTVSRWQWATISSKSSTLISTHSARLAMPPFPGQHLSRVAKDDRATPQQSACSRPPEPMTKTCMPSTPFLCTQPPPNVPGCCIIGVQTVDQGLSSHGPKLLGQRA